MPKYRVVRNNQQDSDADAVYRLVEPHLSFSKLVSDTSLVKDCGQVIALLTKLHVLAQ